MEFREHLNNQLAPSTVATYIRAINLFFAAVKNPDQSTYQQIMDYLGTLRKKQNNINVPLVAIKKYYQYLVDTKQRNDNPARSIKLRDHKTKAIQLQDLFSTAELELLLQRTERYPILKNRNQIIISLLIYQALTNAEIKNLTVQNINLEEGKIQIKPRRKSNGRALQLQPNQVFWLMKYLQEDRPKLLKIKTNQLLINKLGEEETGGGINYVVETQKHLFPDRVLNTITIRQSVITNLLKEGKDLRIVQAFAGHKQASTTERYKQTQVEKLKNQILKYHPLK